MGEPRVCDLGGFGVVGADWCLGWKEGRNLGFVIWGFGVVEVGRERLNLGIVFVGGESWIGCRLIAAFSVASNRRIWGVGAFVWKLGAASGRRHPQQPFLLHPPPDRASDLVSPLLLRRSQPQRPHCSEKLILRGVELHFDRSQRVDRQKYREISRKIGKKSIFVDISAITLPFQCSL